MPAAKIQKNRKFSVIPPIFLCRGVEANGLSASADAVSALSTDRHDKNQDQNQQWPHRPTTRKASLGFADQLATVPPLEKFFCAFALEISHWLTVGNGSRTKNESSTTQNKQPCPPASMARSKTKINNGHTGRQPERCWQDYERKRQEISF